ncbi:hypothetical protein [Reticulibacter mediterranei]|uniref:hypothetical protein n=1 Tax=Reticulibacter mediterranei TaxID=2778369 RepID=UPI001C68F62E|nr:hypothetical protein [Reticulibacter mediterranei]
MLLSRFDQCRQKWIRPVQYSSDGRHLRPAPGPLAPLLLSFVGVPATLSAVLPVHICGGACDLGQGVELLPLLCHLVEQFAPGWQTQSYSHHRLPLHLA